MKKTDNYVWNEWREAASTTFPSPIDNTSSPTTVYVRRNVKPFTRTEEFGEGEEPRTITGYTYEECSIPIAEWDDNKELKMMQAELSSLQSGFEELSSILMEMMN